MGVNSGISKEWKVETEEGREHIRTKVVNQSGLIAAFDASIKRSFRNDGVWYDISGQDNHLLLSGVTYTSDSKGGLVFGNGSSAVAMKPFTNNFASGYTVSAWIKHTGVVSTARVQRYVTVEPEVAVLRHNTSSAASLQTYLFNSASVSTSVDIANQILTNQYYHIVASYDFDTSTSNLDLYLNGVQIGTGTLAKPIRSNASFRISHATEYFEGNIYAMTIYNRALTQTEIKRNYLSTYDRFF